MYADTDSVTQSPTLLSLLQQAVDAFAAANRGLRVKVTGFMKGMGGVIPAIIAGTGPAIISDWYPRRTGRPRPCCPWTLTFGGTTSRPTAGRPGSGR